MSNPSSRTDKNQVVLLEQHRQFPFIIIRLSWKQKGPSRCACKMWCHYRERFKARVMDLFMTFIIESKKFRRMTGSKAQICWKRHSYLSSTKPEKVPLMASSKQNSDLAELCVLCLQFCWRMCFSGSCWGKQWLIFDTILQYISRFNASSVRVTSAGLDSNHFRLFILLWIMFWLQHIKSSL